MQLRNCNSLFRFDIVNFTIGVILLAVVATNFWHSRYNRPDGVIEWDIKSYYAWLPASLIYRDLSLEFRSDDIEKFGDLIWPIETPLGKQAIITTMGMSVLYFPLFLPAHGYALISGYEADGYSKPYRFALTFSALFYLLAGMIFLKKILSRFYDKRVVAFTLLMVVMGTNLYYYSSYEAPMTHAFTFALIAAFILLTIKFYENPSLRLIIAAGILAGFITLIRPVNIIVLIIFFLWDVSSINGLKNRAVFFLGKYYWVLIMASGFILVWVPQFIYWYGVSGKIFYFSYGEEGGKFFFGNPQIFNILFSIKKGWLIYTPLMVFAFAGIFVLLKEKPGQAVVVIVFTALNIYVLSSWWNWWYGGGFGLRSFIDSYAVMALPLAAITNGIMNSRKVFIKTVITGIMIMLLFYNQFQTRQYVNNAIHWWWMNTEAYKETFLRLKPTERFWKVITLPDHDLARQGIYVSVRPEINDQAVVQLGWKDAPDEETLILWIMNNKMSGEEVDYAGAQLMLETAGREYYIKLRAVSLIIEEILSSPDMKRYIEDKALINRMPFDSMLLIDAEWIFNNQQ